MSKQLAISACASIFAMAAFALFAAPLGAPGNSYAAKETGAAIEAAAPAVDRIAPALFDYAR